MPTIPQRFISGVLQSAINVPYYAAGGAVGGASYAFLADLPIGKAAKIWAVAVAVFGAMKGFVDASCRGHLILQESLFTVICFGSLFFGLDSLSEHGVLGDKLLIVLAVAAMTQLFCFGLLIKSNMDENEPEQEYNPWWLIG